MKIIALIFPLHIALNCFAQRSESEFGIFFGNDFDNDSVTVIVNGVVIAENVLLRATMISPQNLIIIQDRHQITIKPYSQPKQILKTVQIKNSILNLKIKMNNVWWDFRFDLKEGKILFPEFVIRRIGWSALKILTIRQSQQPALML